MKNGIAQVFFGEGFAGITLSGHQLLHGIIEVNDHDDARFHGQPEQGDETHGHRYREMNSVEIHHVGPANERKRNGDQTQQGFAHRVESEVQAAENHEQYNGQDEQQGALAADEVFVLPAPLQVVAGGQLALDALHPLHGFFHGAAEVAVAHVEEHRAAQLGILRVNHRRAVDEAQGGHGRERHRPISSGLNRDAAQGCQTVAKVLGQAHVDGEAAPPFHGVGHGRAADGGFHYLVHLVHGQAVAGQLRAVEVNLQILAAGDGVHVQILHAGHAVQRRPHPLRHLVDGVELLAVHFHAHVGANAGAEHVDAVDDGLGPAVHHAGNLQLAVQFLDELGLGHAGPPLSARLKLNDGFNHAQRGIVGGGAGPAGLAEHTLHLGHLHDNLVLHLQNALYLGVRYVGLGDGHEQNRALIERRHKFGAQAQQQRNAHGQQCQVDADGGFAPGQAPVDERRIHPLQAAIDGVLLLGFEFALHEKGQQHRRQRHGQHGINQQNKRLGVGQRVKQLALLPGEQKHRQKRSHDDNRGKENAPRHLLAGFLDDGEALVVGHDK